MAIQRDIAFTHRPWSVDDAILARATINLEERSCDELGITEAQSVSLSSAIISQCPLFSETMMANHHQCDLLFSRAKAFIARDDWEQGRPAFDHFRNAMKQHFLMDEEVLFPSLNKCMEQTMGPIRVMQLEHEQMRQLLSDMEVALAREDRDQYLGFAGTLMVTIQQHNMREVQILFPMNDQAFGSETAEILQRIESI